MKDRVEVRVAEVQSFVQQVRRTLRKIDADLRIGAEYAGRLDRVENAVRRSRLQARNHDRFAVNLPGLLEHTRKRVRMRGGKRCAHSQRKAGKFPAGHPVTQWFSFDCITGFVTLPAAT